MIYQTQKELRAFAIYSDTDVEAFAKEYFNTVKQDARAMGRMTSILKPVADRYNKKSTEERYQFRRQVRNLIKTNGYISQICVYFIKISQEYVFCSYLLNLLPPEAVSMIDLEGKLKLEYYKLQKTFEGSIELQETKGVYEPANIKVLWVAIARNLLTKSLRKSMKSLKAHSPEGDKVLLQMLCILN